jgi:hypothetical protein
MTGLGFIELPPEDLQGYLQREKDLWLGQRRALLMQVDLIERLLGMEPTTADLRKKAKYDRIVGKP